MKFYYIKTLVLCVSERRCSLFCADFVKRLFSKGFI